MAQILIADAPATGRTSRRPSHRFNLNGVIGTVQPFLIAPVLPGETLTNVHLESRGVSKPLLSDIMGWTVTEYLFYVKIRDLNERDTLDDLFINPAGASLSTSAAHYNFYYNGKGYNYVEKCLRRVTECYFRDEGETWNTWAYDSLPKVQLAQYWMDSVVDTTVLTAGTGDPGATTTPEALDAMMDAYEYVRALTHTVMSFEDYCRLAGVIIPRSEVHKPELLVRKREYHYPSNTVDPNDGSASSAVSYVHKITDGNKTKGWLFKEPGFIFGVQTITPKLLFKGQDTSMSAFLTTGLSWLPSFMQSEPETRMREFTNLNGPLAGTTNGYWVDMADLFVHGDQFTNFSLTDPYLPTNYVALPEADLDRKYPTDAMLNGLWVSSTWPNYGFRVDGVCNLSIKSTITDQTGSHHAQGQ